MRALIVEDDNTCRVVLNRILTGYGECVMTDDGAAALDMFREAHNDGEPFDLICLDIQLPDVDGHAVLHGIREFEDGLGLQGTRGTKVIMVTALRDAQNVLGAFRTGCEGYVVKPVDRAKIHAQLHELGFVPESTVS